MLYFAYAADLWAVGLLNWTRGDDRSIVRIVSQGPAVLPDHRLAFPTYNAAWQGGEASAIASPGKQVSGLLLELSDAALSLLDRRAGRDASATEGARPQRVTVFPYRGQPVQAMTYQSADDHGGVHVPPTTRYIDRLASAAADARLSTVWIMHLLSFRPRANDALHVCDPAADDDLRLRRTDHRRAKVNDRADALRPPTATCAAKPALAVS